MDISTKWATYEYWLCDTQAEGSHPLPGLSAPFNPRNAQPAPPNRTRYPNYSETSANDNPNHAQQLLESWQVAIGTCGPTQLDNFLSLHFFGNFRPFWILYGPCSAFAPKLDWVQFTRLTCSYLQRRPLLTVNKKLQKVLYY